MENTRAFFPLLILSIFLLKLCLYIPTQTHEKDLEKTKLELTKVNNEDSWPLLYEKQVVSLNGNNFREFMGNNKYVMVMFYANWCYWSQKLAPEFAAAAKLLKGEAELVMVDAYLEKDLAKKYDIYGYPTLYLFVGGVMQFQFFEQRKRDVISAWVRKKIALSSCSSRKKIPFGIYNITTMDEAERILTTESKLVLGFLDDLEGTESKELAAASKLHSDINFYQTTSSDVAELFHIYPQIKRPALIFLQLVAGKAILFDDQFTRLAIANFVTNVTHPLVVTFTKQNAKLIFQNSMKQLWLFAPAYRSGKVVPTFEEVAKALKAKLLYVYVEMDSEGVGKRVSEEFGITGNASRVIAYNVCGAKKFVLNSELTFSSIKFFGEAFLEDKLMNQSESDQSSETSLIKLPSHSGASYQLRSHRMNLPK